MFKNCKNLFDLSRKLGSVVTGLGLAGVLFLGQVSAVWTDKEKACFIAAVTEYGLRSFPAISRYLYELGIYRSSTDYSNCWYGEILRNHPDLSKYLLSTSGVFTGRRSKFTPEEDASIIRLVQQYSRNHQVIPWEAIARRLWSGKTARQCRARYYNLTAAHKVLNTTPFTPEENESLMRLVQEHGEWKWMRIAELLGNGRTAIQCKFRYRYLLQKNRNRVPIPQITTASLLAAPITGSDNQSAVNATDTSNAATQSRQVFPCCLGHFRTLTLTSF